MTDEIIENEKPVLIPTKMNVSRKYAKMLKEIEEALREQVGFRPLKSELHVSIFEKGIDDFYARFVKK
jgi:hypothetical protein